MTAWTVAVIIGCAVVGFMVVSFILEAIAFNSAPKQSNSGGASEQKSGDNGPSEQMPKDTEWFEVLGVSRIASVEEIKAAYRSQVRQYHPDRLEGLGAELRQLAELKMKQLNAAYDYALRNR